MNSDAHKKEWNIQYTENFGNQEKYTVVDWMVLVRHVHKSLAIMK
jgi:hypothetical protein